MSKKIKSQAPKGMNDILPSEQPAWAFIANKAQEIFGYYGFEKIETPIVESTALFSSAVGKATDIVDKEMYSFKTKGGDELSLRPESTAAVVRAYIEHGMQVLPQPVQLWYYGPFFRHENPQFGRYRQFHQIGIESFGDDGPAADATSIFIGYKLLESLGLKNLVVKINSIGDAHCRPQFIKALKDHYRARIKKVCPQCKERLKTNVMRVLDCKDARCKEVAKDAPQMVDFLDEECKKHFKTVLEFLDETGVTYFMDSQLVRGLDYYSRTVFEICQEDSKEGASNIQLTILGGGRYDDLVDTLGGPKTPAVGWGMGIERLVLLLKEQEVVIPQLTPAPQIFIVQLGELAKRKSLVIFEQLRTAGIFAQASFGKDNIKSQLRIAHRLGVKYAIIVGQKEALDATVILREMNSGVQESIPVEKFINVVKQRLVS